MWVGAMSGRRAHRAVVRVGVRVGAALVCGFIMTIAVAWGSAGFVSLSGGKCSVEWHVQEVDYVAVEVIRLTATRRACACNPPYSDLIESTDAAFALGSAWDRSGPTMPTGPTEPMAGEILTAGWGPTARDIRLKASGNLGTASWLGDARGWPRRAVWCELTVNEKTQVDGVKGGIPLGHPAQADALTFRALPYRPIWSGLVIDSACFGAAWSVLLLFRPARAWRRTRRGHCPRCNYSLAASGGAAAGCPECGWGR
jgi:hypothetical protein